jgi:cell division control protein 12
MQQIRDCISTHGIQVYSPPVQSDDEESTRRNTSILSAMPFSIIASETDVVVNGQKVRGRQYLWGVAEGTTHPVILLELDLTIGILYS